MFNMIQATMTDPMMLGVIANYYDGGFVRDLAFFLMDALQTPVSCLLWNLFDPNSIQIDISSKLYKGLKRSDWTYLQGSPQKQQPEISTEK